VGPKGRVFGNTIINVVYVFGVMTLAGLAWHLQSWRHILRIVYPPAILVFSYLWILNESVRWLLSKGKSEEAVRILNKAAKCNKVELSEDLLAPLQTVDKLLIENEKLDSEKIEIKTESTYLQVAKSGIIRKRLVICSFLWITCTFVYYGLSINSVSLAGNKYVNFMLTGFVEIPANFVCLLVLDRIGRKRTLIITYILSAILCISFSFLPKGEFTYYIILLVHRLKQKRVINVLEIALVTMYIICLLRSPLLGHRPSLWTIHKEIAHFGLVGANDCKCNRD
jgi:MFS family permease